MGVGKGGILGDYLSRISICKYIKLYAVLVKIADFIKKNRV
ncbi:MAG: hypothetical protein UY31_C0070G0006 [Candidatus Wolfebacteria bacterium GW2011_GWE1_48_7]|nr:MAG: hypothetical protein UX49_C0047G0005 [Candidatus Wolfebacteria bacterium GW2011_GWC2_46_275]KKU41486.1 MAG: hypothetical protein UX58_C0008G0052 [Candidatus Wolfebacteria bacterium GW2011_GWB2_46_69]KKU53574.1 MAG: hypothetical protein UX76_C0013G0002 [Candidatus Wolfebacteria bacterium GW2011_GWC1_47_103]KKU58805.1 MAG: hypothetical protein UX83_C0011G0017 [Candidatus Wolfebacteria bacterium GW2011_GWE2_47_12]KKU65438.1 MAG: hypothetical protein UX90_C0005G0002 [Candidatus Wolfebacteri